MKKNMTYNSESYKIAFLAALFLIGTITIYDWFVVPHQNYLKAAQTYESTVSNLGKKKQIINNNLKTYRIESEKLTDQLSGLEDKLFDLVGERNFFSNIENLCEKTSCKMLSLTFSQSNLNTLKNAKQPSGYEYATASSANLSLEGRYGNIVSMMNKLQDTSKLVRLSSVNINTNSEKPGYLKCQMIITIYVTN